MYLVKISKIIFLSNNREVFSLRTRSLVALDRESLYKGQMHEKMQGRNK
jgi:hypothetical protein